MGKGATLTWGPRLSSDPRSGTSAALVAAAGGAPRGDHPQVVVVAVGPMALVAAGPMVAVAED
jgi:hypothetical protein